MCCNKISSVSPLKTIKKVSLTTTGKSGFTDLGEVFDLFLSLKDEFKFNDKLIGTLNNRRLTLINSFIVITSLSVFSSSILHIAASETFAKFINDGQGVLLKHLLSLKLELLNVVKLEGVEHIPTIRIVRCDYLQTMQGLDSNRYVEVNTCSALQDVSSLASVPIVTIKGCFR